MDFFDTPIEAALARKFGNTLLDKGAETVNLKSFRYYDRMIPTQDILNDGEVGNLIALPLQEAGVKVTIVTWHPDEYKYGKDEHRIELMELLRNAGFHIELMTESCQHYAVVDKEIVWYGSMNLLSKDDIEDNIMRVSSKAIAEKLLEMTFRKDNDLNEYQLPLDII